MKISSDCDQSSLLFGVMNNQPFSLSTKCIILLTADGLTKYVEPNTVVREDNNDEKITGKQDNQTGASCWHSCNSYNGTSLASANWIFIHALLQKKHNIVHNIRYTIVKRSLNKSIYIYIYTYTHIHTYIYILSRHHYHHYHYSINFQWLL